jgi:hypothetical protein
MFIPSQYVLTGNTRAEILLVPVVTEGLSDTAGHYAAIAINFAGLILAFITVFLYSRRALQVRLSYLLMFMWLVLTLMIIFCPFTEQSGGSAEFSFSYTAVATGVLGFVSAYLAARYIKKDIELLKSADRIR